MYKVHVKGDHSSYHYEICVIEDNYDHGIKSYGWGDEKKIILFSSGLGCNSFNPCTEEKFDFGIKCAKLLVKELNSL